MIGTFVYMMCELQRSNMRGERWRRVETCGNLRNVWWTMDGLSRELDTTGLTSEGCKAGYIM